MKEIVMKAIWTNWHHSSSHARDLKKARLKAQRQRLVARLFRR
ncbi:hypothetical protein ANCCAN_26366 [Ancylostoma caninum]|uniref:Uncharacterized protein n=1 Tax=Ancylostoma caninum TaxID=29170 RepID=A0A368FCJ7_ANCCA|nr:hypothetical protein ANCCAN_26366 [Ancylostoma caninum]